MVAPQAQTKHKPVAWPNTFSGQPDFVFERAEVITEEIEKSKEQNEAAPIPALIDDLLADTETLTPLDLEKKNVDSTEVTDEGEVDLASLTAFKNKKADISLPDVLSDALLDVSEFKKLLQTAAKQAVRKARVNEKEYQFEKDLARLTLQAVVTSPIQYAVINNRRYTKGDRLHVMVPVEVTQADLVDALMAHMPPENALQPERYKQYQEAYKEVLSATLNKQSSDNAAFVRTQRLPVKIKDIQSRKVILNIGGRDYELEVKYRL